MTPGVVGFTIDGGEYVEDVAPTCDPRIDVELGGWVPDIAITADFFTVFGAVQGVPLPVEVAIDVPAAVDASFNANDGIERIRWSAVDASPPSDPSYICVAPTSDTPVWQGVSGTQGTWRHRLDDALADFEGRQVRERTTGAIAYDDCFDHVVNANQGDAQAATIALNALNCYNVPLTGPTGWHPNIDNANTTVNLELDYTGYDDICVAAYRALGATPCEVGTIQPMQALCQFPQVELWWRYDTHQLKQDIDTLGAGIVRHSKDGGATWYP